MAQHFLLSAAARSLSLAKVMRLSDTGVEEVFLRLRWPETDGKPVCPDCGCSICYACRRPEGQLRWRCKACRGDFSITSGTLFAWHKLPLRKDLLAVAGFCNEVRGKSMLALARDLDVQTQDGVRAGAHHQHGYSIDGACTNGAESYFSRLRRAELGHHHHIAGPYLVRYAQEAAWREDLRRVSNGEQTYGVVGLAMPSSPSVDFCGYWQRAQAV